MIKVITPDIFEKDAIGNFCLDIYSLISSRNHKVGLYAEHFEENKYNVDKMDVFFDTLEKNDVIFYNYSIYDTYLERIISLPNKKICYFHGVTPYELLLEYEPITAELCKKSVEQFSLLKNFDVIMANSNFSANYLKTFLEKEIIVYPPLFKTRQFLSLEKLHDNKNKNFLVVGRIVPHKKIEDTITLFEKLSKKFMESKLYIIGIGHNESYNLMLRELVKNLNLQDKVFFLNKVDDEELNNYYKESFSIINASLHEGFGIPVLEALSNGLIPIIRENNAMVEIAGDNALVFSNINEFDSKKLDGLTKIDKTKFKENVEIYLEKSEELLKYLIKMDVNND